MTCMARRDCGALALTALTLLSLGGRATGASNPPAPPPAPTPPPASPSGLASVVVVASCDGSGAIGSGRERMSGGEASGEAAGGSGDSLAGWLTSSRAAGVTIDLLANPPACQGDDALMRPPEGTDIVVHTWRGSRKGTAILRIRIVFSPANRLDLRLYGRPFSAAFASSSIEFPARTEVQGPVPAPGQTLTLTDSPPEAQFLDAMTAMTAYRRELKAHPDGADGPAGPVTGRIEALRARALVRLEEADRRQVESFNPTTSATLKQLRAALILDGACSDDTAAGLLRAAARLVPHDSEARAAAAIARLGDTGASHTCLRETEDELLQSLAQDRWSERRVEDLGHFYELAMNAASGRNDDPRSLPADVAAARLREAWQERAPPAPRCLELGIGAGFATAPTAEALRGSAPAARLEATFARDGAGFGLRLSATLPWTRELVMGTGTASWSRVPIAVGARYRNRVRRFYVEVDGNLAVAPAFAAGHGFDTNLDAVGLDAGAGGGARIGLRFGRLSIWAAAGATYYFARRISWWPDLTVSVDNQPTTTTLPDLDVAAVVGISQILWR
jgi:hypothetical protein